MPDLDAVYPESQTIFKGSWGHCCRAMIAAKSLALWVEECPEDTKFLQFLSSCQVIAARLVFPDPSRNTVTTPVIGVGLTFSASLILSNGVF